VRGRHLSARHAALCDEGVVRVVGVVDAAGLEDVGMDAWREAEGFGRRRRRVQGTLVRTYPNFVDGLQAEELRFRLISEKLTKDLRLPSSAGRELGIRDAASFVCPLRFMHVVHALAVPHEP